MRIVIECGQAKAKALQVSFACSLAVNRFDAPSLQISLVAKRQRSQIHIAHYELVVAH
jgi:hypothetical protein